MWVWPECWEVVCLFLELDTQWRWVSGMIAGGALRTGLDYPAVEALLRLKRVPAARRSALFADLRVLEAAALAVWREEAEREHARRDRTARDR